MSFATEVGHAFNDIMANSRVFGLPAWQCWWCHRILPVLWVGRDHNCDFSALGGDRQEGRE